MTMINNLVHSRYSLTFPAVIADADDQASNQFIEFFATISNKNTRTATS
jgi:hypothetical protein